MRKLIRFDLQRWLTTTGFVVATVFLVVVSGGNIGAAIAPMAGIAALFVFAIAPLRYTATLFFAVVLLVHMPSENAHLGHWQGPLSLFSSILYDNLRHHTRIGALKFNLIEAGFGLMLIIVAVRTLMGNNIDRHKDLPAARSMKIAAAVSLAALLITVFWGMARGGRFDQVLWQVRALFWLPFLLVISMRAFKTDADFRRLGVALGVVCVARVTEGLFFYHVVAGPAGLYNLDFIMTHTDSVWLATFMVILISSFMERLDRRSLFTLVGLGGYLMYGVVMNDRRLAYVSMAMSLIAIIVFIRRPVRRVIVRALIVLLPVVLLYVAVGMRSNAAIFAPVRNLVSVGDANDSSNWSRNVENFNLIQTLRSNPILGTGWGHEYNEIIFAWGLEEAMPTYRYHPHNTMLGVVSFSGAFGTWLIWIYLPVGVFLASRAYGNASNPTQRITAITMICAVIIYLTQAYGDLGAEDTDIAMLLSTCLACVANMAERTLGPTEQ